MEIDRRIRRERKPTTLRNPVEFREQSIAAYRRERRRIITVFEKRFRVVYRSNRKILARINFEILYNGL